MGIGTMRLPYLGDDFSKIDEPKAIEMIRYAIDQGVNYVDTAYMYHDGFSEVLVGKALKDGYREKVLLADKMPAWYAKSEAEVEALFEKQLERLEVDCIDTYLVHNITRGIWKVAEKNNVMAVLERKRQEGKIKYIGFSFHDQYDFFEEIIDIYPWDFCQIQLNYMDTEFQAGLKGLKLAGSKGIPVVIMEPLKGGRLAVNGSKKINAVFKEVGIEENTVAFALKWLANYKEVAVILNGVSTLEQVKENVEILKDLKPNCFTETEVKKAELLREGLKELIKVDCTECKYCMPCPFGVDIPGCFRFYNDYFLYEHEGTKEDFHVWINPKNVASKCTGCGACETHCPQGIRIIEELKKVAHLFEKPETIEANKSKM